MKTKTKIIAGVIVALLILISGYFYFSKDKGVEKESTLFKGVVKARVIEKEKVLLEAKQVTKIIGYEEKSKKEYTYKDNEFELKMTEIEVDDFTTTKIMKYTWNGLKGNINEMGERVYYQNGTYEVAYGVDVEKNPLEMVKINEHTGVIELKEPVVSILYFSMPFDKMEFEVEDRTQLSKGKIKITKQFTTEDRQKLYEDLVKKAKEELEKEKNKMALVATKEAIRDVYKAIDPDIVIKFVE